MDALKGSAVALVSSLLVAFLFAYTFRLPIPLEGMLGPLGEFSPYTMRVEEVAVSVFAAWLLYGISGGFIVLSLVGGLAGRAAGRRYGGARNKNRIVMLYAALASAIPVAGLSVLDYIIGPW